MMSLTLIASLSASGLLLGLLLAGYGMSGNKDRSWLHIIAFAAV